MVGTDLVFSPVRYPQSNAYVERFHQDYQKHVWEDTYLAIPKAVQSQAEHFFDLYRHSPHHSALQGQTPDELHNQAFRTLLPSDFSKPSGKLPLYAGRVHFMRRVDPDATVSVLNVKWTLPSPDFNKGVWITLEINPQGATLSIYDQAPDAVDRKRLAVHPFPLSEPVFEHDPVQKQPVAQVEMPPLQVDERNKLPEFFPVLQRKLPRLPDVRLPQAFRSQAQRLKRFLNETIY